MGFSANAAKRAAIATKNAGAEQAINWVLQNTDKPDLNDPLPSAAGGGGADVPEESIALLAGMGFQACGSTPQTCADASDSCDRCQRGLPA